MSIFDTLRNAVFENDPNAVNTTMQPQPTAQQPQQRNNISGIPNIPGISGISSTPASAQSTILPSATQGTADVTLTATFVGKLREKFEASAFAGVLTQFTSTLEALTEDTPEEGKRFRMAAKVTKLSADQLAEAYNSLLTVLETESGKFKAHVDQQRASEIDSRDQQVQQINGQIEELNKQIETLSSQRDGILTDTVAAKTKLAAATVSFEGAIASLQSEVNDSIQKLRIYLQPTAKK